MSATPTNPTQAEALLRAGRFAEAAAAFRPMAARQPANLSIQRAYAAALARAGKASDARAVLRRALKIAPRNYDLLVEMAMTALALGDTPGADEASTLALGVRPEDPNVLATRAVVLQRAGRHGEAWEVVSPSVLGGSLHAPSVQVFLELCLWRGEIDRGVGVARRSLDAGGGSFNERRLRSAYAQLLEKGGEFDRAFEQYQRVNRIKGGAGAFDPDAFDALVDRICELWTPESLDALPPAPTDTHLPVFIVGMPRSGSSLVERVLDRHPEVSAAGEIPALQETVEQVVPPEPVGPVAALPDPAVLTRPRLDRFARQYLRELRRVTGPARRVTDKSLTNFMHVGAIRAAMPGATVVHCVRDPMDTCLSCYCQDFASPTPFTQDLRVLGRFYNTYRRLMSHWDAVVAPPPTEVVYERVVEDVAGEARRLVEAVDLDWDEACARPHEGGGATLTASRDQVRRKVYASSVGRWRRFERHLGPLMDALDDRYLEAAG